MRQHYTLLVLLLAIQINAFDDDDIDGVANTLDLCPDTSFEETVDEDGCPENQHYLGKITFAIGGSINSDGNLSTNDYNFFSNYNYKNWDFSLYNSQQDSLDSSNNKTQSTGDLYISMGYGITKNNLYSKLTLGTKLATGSSEVSTGENDYFTTLSLNYTLNQKIALISSLSYTKTGKNSENDYQNSLGFSLGIGYMLNNKWYSSLSYQQSSSIYKDSDDYKSISLFNNYNFNKSFFITFNYSRGLDSLSYDQTITTSLGVTFE